ncbi:MAG: formyltransferase family protein [Bacilli bacterium]
MKIVLVSMNDPMYTIPFMKDIMHAFRDEIALVVTVTKGNRMTLSKGKSKIAYLISLFLIMGLCEFFKSAIIQVWFKLRILVSMHVVFVKSPELTCYAQELGIKAMKIANPNSKCFLDLLEEINPDIIINQSQAILKKRILSLPRIGVLNRHNALLPKNRGRLTPFWVLLHGERHTGVSIHLMVEALDAGPIIVQKKYEIDDKDNFNTLVRKNYQIASKAMIEAITLLADGFDDFIDNNDADATYNSTPTLKDALRYRAKMIRRLLA